MRKMQPTRKVAQKVAPSGSEDATIFDDTLERLKAAMNTKSDTAFAKALGLRQSSVSGAKKRQQIPPAWGVQVAEKTGVSLDWLLLGKKGQNETGDHPEEQTRPTPIYNDRKPEVPRQQPMPTKEKSVPSIADLLTKTARVLESETVYQTALTSNIEAFYHSVELEERIDANEANTNKMFQEMRKEIQTVRNENKQLRDEIQRDRDQEAVEDTG